MKSAERPVLSGIILAAGSSTRMGRPKQLLPLEDRPLLQHVLDAAVASRLDEVILVLGHCADEIRSVIICADRVRVVVNDEYAAGQSTSLRAGLRAADTSAVAAAILLGDQPGVTAPCIDRLAAGFIAGNANLVRPVYLDPHRGRVPGHPVFLARRVWHDVEELRGDEGARALLPAHPDWLLEVPLEGAAPRDIDTWGDYRDFERRLP